MKLEICANSYESAKNAQEAGAHRIELCSELAVGGITPSYGLMKQVTQELSIEVFVLIRPRSGDFKYTDVEFEIMKSNIKLCKELGVSGIVSGVLNEDYTLDIERTKALIELSKPMRFTFHRAFDCVPSPFETLEQLIDLGVSRILTSGQKPKAEQGLELLQQLQKQASGRLVILVGSGININNIKQFKNINLLELHASASKTVIPKNDNSYFENVEQTVSDVEIIQSILKEIK